MASKELSRPQVKSALQDYAKQAENILNSTMVEYSTSEDIKERSLSVDISKYIHDKSFGKATQQIQVNQNTITINLDLTGSISNETTEVVLTEDEEDVETIN